MTISESFRVLIVEDEPRYRELLVNEIGHMGYPACGTAKAEDALRLLEREKFAALLVDLNLRGMNGMDLLALIRRRGLDLGVIVLTACGQLDSAVEALRLHADDYLARPCTLGDIERALAELQKRHAERMRAAQFDRVEERLPPPRPNRKARAPRGTSDDGTLEDLERVHILSALAHHHGNKPAAAAQLGISLRTLYNRLKQYSKEGYVRTAMDRCDRN